MKSIEIDLHKELKKYFGFGQFKGLQEQVINSIISGNNTFVIMPTGGGKSLCYQLPAMMLDGTAIVVSPLIALMKNQVDAVRGLSSEMGIAHVLNSSLTKTEINKVKEDIKRGVTKLLYVAPESLTKDEYVEFLNTVPLSFIAIDEAHCISEWGHDFRPEYRNLRNIIRKLGDIPIIGLTATATPKVQEDILKNLEIPDANVFKASFNRPNLYYEVRPKTKDVESHIIKFINQFKGKSGVVYCLSRKKVAEITQVLQVNGISAVAYHAGLDPKTRAKHQDMFLMEDVDVVVATIAFGMGIDKPDVRFVIHHDIPKSLESYYQETGRGGRDGGVGECLAFYSYKDIEKLEKFLHGTPIAEQEIGRQLLFEIVSYSETSICRRKFLLHYFGEEYDETNCNQMCDNCRNPKEKYEGKDEILTLLKSVEELKEMQKADYLCSYINGEKTTEIISYKHDKLPGFAAGKNKDKVYWNAAVRQALVGGLLSKDIESYGVIKLTDKGREFIKNPTSFTLIKEHVFSDSDDDDFAAGGIKDAFDEVLYQALLDLRKQISREKKLPPFVIFQEDSLKEMSFQYPITKEELSTISGVGNGKAKRYGAPFLALIKDYVEENEIERPQDLVVRSLVNKSGLKVQLIQNIDRKLPLEDIGEAQGKTLEEIIEEIEVIVNSGTRVNINYYIDEILDDDNQEEIYEYFYEAETDTIEDAYNEFEGDYTEEELRLMRIKFMSEVAN